MRILLFANTDWFLWNFKRALARGLPAKVVREADPAGRIAGLAFVDLGPRQEAWLDKLVLEIQKRRIALRKARPALQVGDYRTLLAEDRRGLFAFQRRLGEEVLVVVLNNSPSRQRLEVPVGGGSWEPVLGQGPVLKARRSGRIVLNLEGRSGLVLARRTGS